jgi:hypothetical protein
MQRFKTTLILLLIVLLGFITFFVLRTNYPTASLLTVPLVLLMFVAVFFKTRALGKVRILEIWFLVIVLLSALLLTYLVVSFLI